MSEETYYLRMVTVGGQSFRTETIDKSDVVAKAQELVKKDWIEEVSVMRVLSETMIMGTYTKKGLKT